jgi:hypothetical protein
MGRNHFLLMLKGESNFIGENHHHRGILCMNFDVNLPPYLSLDAWLDILV